MFPKALDPATELNPRSRKITVTHQDYVLIDGCLELEHVLIDGIEIPMTDMRAFSKQDPGKEPEMVLAPVPLLSVQDVPGVGRCLLRSIFSNHGQWQIGSTLIVTGEWAEGPEEHFVSNLAMMPVLAEKDKQIAEAQATAQRHADEKDELATRLKELAAEVDAMRQTNGAELGAKEQELEELRKKASELESFKSEVESNAAGLKPVEDDKDALLAEKDAKIAELEARLAAGEAAMTTQGGKPAKPAGKAKK